MIHRKHLPPTVGKVIDEAKKIYPRYTLYVECLHPVIQFNWHRPFSTPKKGWYFQFNPEVHTIQQSAKNTLKQIKEIASA